MFVVVPRTLYGKLMGIYIYIKIHAEKYQMSLYFESKLTPRRNGKQPREFRVKKICDVGIGNACQWPYDLNVSLIRLASLNKRHITPANKIKP